MTNPVPNPIQRVRYFDGEYLRSYDFTNDQTYHIEMRRLMNLKLHLYGIVYGLEIVQNQDSVLPGGPFFYSIASGIAIDQLGREIVVPAPYDLSNVLTAPGLGGGKYEVWICYQETQTALPAAGYLDCNAPSQNTRWQEGFQVYLNPLQGQSLMPNCNGVRLGVVILSSGTGLGLQFGYPAYNWGRHYVGIRAQSVIAPDQLDPDNYDIAATNPNDVPDHPRPGYLDVHPSVYNHGNVFVKKNLVIGDDFALNPSSGAPASIPATGNVKITSDLFLNGNFYGFLNNNWYELGQYIQTLIPGIAIGVASIPIDPQGTNILTAQFGPISVTAPFVTSAQPQVMVALTGITWKDPHEFASNWGTGTDPIQVSVTSAGINLSSPGSTSWNLYVNWQVSPNAASGSSFIYPVTAVSISYLVVFMPPPIP